MTTWMPEKFMYTPNRPDGSFAGTWPMPPRHPQPQSTCVYALYDGDTCVYVGSTVTLRDRVRKHARDKQFDRWEAWPVLAGRDRWQEENAAILRLQPTLNPEPIRGHRSITVTGPGLDRQAELRAMLAAELGGRS